MPWILSIFLVILAGCTVTGCAVQSEVLASYSFSFEAKGAGKEALVQVFTKDNKTYLQLKNESLRKGASFHFSSKEKINCLPFANFLECEALPPFEGEIAGEKVLIEKLSMEGK